MPRKTHKMALLAWVLLLIASWSLGTLGVGAQSNSDDLFAFHEGDLWAWQPGETPEQLTTWGYNGGPVISPDGSLVAYRSVASEAVQEIEGGGQGITYAGDAPSNIYIMTASNRNFERIAQQSAIRVFRSSPVWSPDSTRLAWTEMRGDYQPSADVVIYDTRDGSTRTIATIEMGYQDAGFVMPNLQWSESGIARLIYTYSGTGIGESTAPNPNLYWDIIDPMEGSVQRIVAGDVSTANTSVRAWVWAQHQGQWRIVYADGLGNWYVVNTQSGTRQTLLNPPMFVPVNGDNTTMLIPRLANSNTDSTFAWEYHANGVSLVLPYAAYNIAAGMNPVLSPDGRSVAWNEFGTVQVWDSATETTNTLLTRTGEGRPVNIGPMSISWAPMQWVTDGVISDMTAPDVTPSVPDGAGGCPLVPQLSIGMAVEVAPGQEPNRVRTEPSLTAQRLGLLFPGEVAIVQEGPVCADGLNWWRVSWSGLDGWTAEGSNGVYWLVPSG